MKDFLKGVVFVGLFSVLFIPLLVTDSMFFPFITGKNFAFRILVEIVFAAWLVLAFLDSNYRPRFSWVLAGLSATVVVMFFANLFGEYPLKSFWSNFERMDGFVTLVHFFLFTVVLGSTFKDKKIWNYFITTSVVVAGLIALDGLKDFINKEGSWRIDSTLGNAAYMAIYMFFHAFFSVWLFVQSKQVWQRALCGLAFVLFSYLLILTATRGTFLALVGGLTITGIYLLIFMKGHWQVRKYILIGLVTLFVLFAGLFQFKDRAFVAENIILDRITDISLGELSLRFDIWQMAWEGVKERPVLGWGQGNFNYVFDKEYDPDVYFAESWYDRVHNIALDWLIAGGFLGFLAYVSIYVAVLYYLLWRPFFSVKNASKDNSVEDEGFTVYERAIIVGAIGGYVIHNLVVFDNIVSYIFFALVLALLHSRIATPWAQVQNFSLDPRIVTNIIAPAVFAFLVLVVYFVNVPAIKTATYLIDGMTAETLEERLDYFNRAIEADSFAYQEVVEQLSEQTRAIISNKNVPPANKQEFARKTETELLNLAVVKPNDARVHVFISGFYRALGAYEQAKKHIDIARQFSPTKPEIIVEQGAMAYHLGNYKEMQAYFKEAYELQPKFKLAQTLYAASFYYTEETEKLDQVLKTEADFAYFAQNDFAFSTVSSFGDADMLLKILEARIKAEPQNPQYRANLASFFYQTNQIEKSIAVVEEAMEEVVAFEEIGVCYIENLRKGNNPNEVCD